ncbi:MAG TPA: hypothetical protein VJU13_11540 [Candidatus Nitrosocosmicus sp.]|nr:hypothetical protein [Candidatus Nitrosocosmicus sp.]
MTTFNGNMGDLVSQVMIIGCPKCGQKENFQSTVADKIVDQSTPVETLEEMGLGKWSITCGNPTCGYKISKIEEIFRD